MEEETQHPSAAPASKSAESSGSGRISFERMAARLGDTTRQSDAIPRVGFDADVFAGPDLLGIGPDVDAFASLIAAKHTSPPLSIGIFGAWGSGKTFFMRQLQRRVGAIARAARESGTPQKDISFYKRIVQVEFNAWHYVEGNLWASLVEHIFRTLSLGGEEPTSEVEQLRLALLAKLQGEEALKEKAEADEAAAKERLAAAEQSLQKAQIAYVDAEKQLQQLSVENVVRLALADKGVQAAINQVRELVGLKKVEDGAADFEAALGEARSVVDQGASLFAPIVRAPEGWRRLIWLLVFLGAAPLAGLAVAWLTQGAGSAWLSQTSALLTSIAGLFAAGAAWLRRQAQWVSDGIEAVEQARRRFDRAMEQQLTRQREDRTAAEQAVEQRRADLDGAQQEKAAAERRVAQAQADLEQATAERVLATFIQDRVASDDYRKYLGVLASVRQDIERLSKLIAEENDGLDKISAIADEDKQQRLRINRIVLYIDDLDRCPPKKVVEVLQAVNLLLAFELFVVVVAVDTRWIAGSLERMYGDLLRAAPNERAAQEGAPAQATPLDYLEKIFQIPLWLEPMDREDRVGMLAGLLRPRNGDRGGSPAAIALHTTALDIDEVESKFMEDLAPLLGRSPRALKRFVNVYRLVKVSLPEGQQPTFLQQRLYQQVLLLLALVTSMPSVARAFFCALDDLERGIQSHSPHEAAADRLAAPQNTWDWLCARIDGDPDVGQTADWHAARGWLAPDSGEPPLQCQPRDLLPWIRRIGRYSFLPDGALSAPGSNTAGAALN